MNPESSYILTINGGSSSIKFAVFERDGLTKVLEGKIDHIGMDDTYYSITNHVTHESSKEAIEEENVVSLFLNIIQSHLHAKKLVGIGHRIVHGGGMYDAPTSITPKVIHALHDFIHFAPQHLPIQIALIEACTEHFSDTPQFACFDTGFHHDMPQVAQTLPIPRIYAADGLRRFGFHGLSYEYLMHELEHSHNEPVGTQKIILAHLGNGSSLAAVLHGNSIETSMGFTPMSGVPMGTRSGDIDPGLLEYFIKPKGFTPDELIHMLNYESGTFGISGGTADMEVLLQNAHRDPRAEEAVAFFCYHIKKYIGTLSAVLDGVDVLVFTGGMGEKSAEIRKRICNGLSYLGVEIDDARNDANSICISTEGSRVIIYTIPANEELVIARHVQNNI